MEMDVDAMLKEMLILQALVREHEKRIDEIKSWCKRQGSFATKQYVCNVIWREQTRMVPLEAAEALYGNGFLQQHKLIHTINFQMVQVSEAPREIIV